MTDKELELCGYRKYKNNILNNCDWYWARMVTDDVGKKYQIVVSVYDWRSHNLAQKNLTYQPEVQFGTHGEDRSCNVTKLGDCSVKEMEEFFYGLWVYLGKPYYEKWEVKE